MYVAVLVTYLPRVNSIKSQQQQQEEEKGEEHAKYGT
jgi:hypothetical protein